jgi:hypothetical protein
MSREDEGRIWELRVKKGNGDDGGRGNFDV